MAFYRLKELVINEPMRQTNIMGNEDMVVVIGGEEMIFSKDEFDLLFEQVR